VNYVTHTGHPVIIKRNKEAVLQIDNSIKN